MMPTGLEDRGVFPPLDRARVVSTACSSPEDIGRAITRWTIAELAQELGPQSTSGSISSATVWRILNEAELRPHRVRYWLNPRDPDFEKKAASVLWYYERAVDLACKGIPVLCVDEKPGIQALGRTAPDIPAAPGGRPVLREHEYVRHGTVNLLVAYELVSGRVWGRIIPTTNRFDFIESLELLLQEYSDCPRVELILDNASSHTANDTQQWFADNRARVRAHFTPKHASWLNQAELALSAFSRRYLNGRVVNSRCELISKIEAGLVEYNALFAKPFEWSFTRHAMHGWWKRHLGSQKN